MGAHTQDGLYGLLIYQASDYQINKGFADWLCETAAAYDIRLRLIFRERLALHTDSGHTSGGPLCLSDLSDPREAMNPYPDFVINRSRDFLLTEYLEMMGIPVFNSAYLSRLGNRKELGYAYAATRGVPVLPYRLWLRQNPRQFDTPKVIKTPDGHGGDGVEVSDHYLPKGYLEAGDMPQSDIQQPDMQSSADWMIGQDYLKTIQGDIRVYVIGGQPYAAVLRRVIPGSHLANFTKGAQIEFFSIKNTPVEAALKKLLTGVRMDYCGVDFLLDSSGQIYFNEFEDVVGARMLSALDPGNTTYHLPDALIRHILGTLSGRAV